MMMRRICPLSGSKRPKDIFYEKEGYHGPEADGMPKKSKVYIRAIYLCSLILLSLFLSVCCMDPVPSCAADITPGSFLKVESYVKNLSSKDGTKLRFEALYTPKTYRLIFDANGGHFPDGAEEREQAVVYNDGSLIYDSKNTKGNYLKSNDSFIRLPEEPVLDKHSFIGWYLKGNDMPKSPGALDGVLIKDGSRYMIANDDQGDLKDTIHTEDGRTKAVALWKANEFSFEDGNGTDSDFTGGDGHEDGPSGIGGTGDEDNDDDDDPSGEGPGGGEGTDDEEGGSEPGGGDGEIELPPEWEEEGYVPGTVDLWDKDNVNNHAVAYVDGIETKAEYESIYGDIGYQYRRIVFNAQTEYALGYAWSVKKKGAADFKALSGNEGTFMADKLLKEDDGSIYRCEVKLGENGEKLTLETEISIYWLPVIGKTEVRFL